MPPVVNEGQRCPVVEGGSAAQYGRKADRGANDTRDHIPPARAQGRENELRPMDVLRSLRSKCRGF